MSDDVPAMTDAQQYSAIDLDSWWSDVPMTDRQLDVLQGEIDNELIPEGAHFHKQVVRKLLAEVERLRGRLESAWTGGDRLGADLISASQERDRLRAQLAEIGETTVEWSVRWHEDGDVSTKQHTEAEARERGAANPKTMTTVSRIVGEWREIEQEVERG